MKTAKGFSLVEVLVTLTVLGLLTVLAAPRISTVFQNARAREAVNRVVQDFNWARGTAANGQNTVSMTLAADCSWTTTVNGTTDASHSMTQANLLARAPGLTCTAVSPSVLPVTFNFDATGKANASSTMLYTLTSGNSWRIQVLSSGSMLIGTGAQ